MSRVHVVIPFGMPSVMNVANKIVEFMNYEGHEARIVDITRVFSTPKANLVIFWSPFTTNYAPRISFWTHHSKCNRIVFYTVIEGTNSKMWKFHPVIKRHYIITPSKFAKRMIEASGFTVSEVIPHQVELNLPVDEDYGRAWRRRFPLNKKILLYVGISINRKGLIKLRKAIDILSRKRDDFLFVCHMNDARDEVSTKVEEMEGVNTVVEPEFGLLDLPQVYAKIKMCDIFVFPSMGEGFGLPVAEALALGKRLVCVNAPAVNEIANPRNSWMVTEVYPSEIGYLGEIMFKVSDYDPMRLAEQLELCLDASKEEAEEKRIKGFEAIKRLEKSYKAFLKSIP